METLFHPDSKFIRVLTKISEGIMLSLLWFFFSLPVITAGASTTALYYTVNKSLFHSSGYVWQEFWGAFKSNFKQSTIAWLLALLFYVVSIFDFFILYSLTSTNGNWNFIIFIIMLALVTFWVCYIFPCIARFENSTRLIMRNALIIAFCNLPKTILLCILLILSLAITLTYLPLIAVTPAIYMYLARWILERVFKKYTSPEDLAAEEERNQSYER